MNLFKRKKNVEEQPAAEQRTWQQNLVLDLKDLFYVLAIFMLIYMLLFRVVVVVGSSMYDTLHNEDRLLLISNTFYHEPKQGDVIVISKDSYDNGAPIVKRVIAVEGQIVDIDFDLGVVYVDGLPLDEPYVNTPTNRAEGVDFPLLVEEGCCFVLGDNRNDSKDSRHPDIGLVDRREILGKAVLLVFPGTDDGMMPRDFGRIGVIR